MSGITEDALSYLVEVGKDLAKAHDNGEIIAIDDQKYLKVQGKLQPIFPIDPPNAGTFTAYTLQGLCDFIHEDIDDLFTKPHIVRVTSETRVEVLTQLRGYKNERAVVAVCDAKIPRIQYDNFMDGESFMLMLMTRFYPSDARDLLMKLAGNLREEQSMQTADDGLSQKVTIKKGVVSVGDVVVKNPIFLSPIRTFPEIDPPESPFVVRFRDGAQVALFEADGGAWRSQAVAKIGDWLRNELEDDGNAVIIA